VSEARRDEAAASSVNASGEIRNAGPDGSSDAGGSALHGKQRSDATEALGTMKDMGTVHVAENDTALVDVMIMPPAPAVS
jgi:hypothetical protein